MANLEDTALQVTLGAGALIVGYLLVRRLTGNTWEFVAERAEVLEGPQVNEAGDRLFGVTPTEWGARGGEWVRDSFADFADAVFSRDYSLNWGGETAMYDAASQRDPAGRDVGIGYR